jgi:hypothetical protein
MWKFSALHFSLDKKRILLNQKFDIVNINWVKIPLSLSNVPYDRKIWPLMVTPHYETSSRVTLMVCCRCYDELNCQSMGPQSPKKLIEFNVIKRAFSEILPRVVLPRPWYVFLCRSEMSSIFYNIACVESRSWQTKHQSTQQSTQHNSSPLHKQSNPSNQHFICTSPTSQHVPDLPVRALHTSTHHNIISENKNNNIHDKYLI